MKKPPKEMSPEEVIKKLQELGFPVGEWTHREGSENVKTQIPMFKELAEKLEALKAPIEQQIAKDREQIDELNRQLTKMKHGGGQ